ncbi:hypothetical protein [Streptomyces sp. MP131-18]|uniref:hypothetical protein n=1 Tax=Streptomyces sp. MP131-18 TaxID=1857892 RepID=UPI00117C3B7E|nr:hypothetical protein [Streptomyces sp. MP131-18]
MPADTSVGTIRLGGEHGVEQLPDAAPRPTIRQRLGRAAHATGAAWVWRHGTSAARLTALGVATPARRVWRYEQGAEFAQQIRETELMIAIEADPERRRALSNEIAQIRVARHQAIHARHRENATLAGLGAGGAAVVALLVATVMVGLVVPAGAAAVGGGAAWWAGRREEKRRGEIEAAVQRAALIAAGEPSAIEGPSPAFGEGGVYSPEQLGTGQPHPIARATTAAEAAECILRALTKEGIPVGDISEVERKPWGWQCIVRVTEGTPAAIIAKAADLETAFDLPQGAVRPQPLVERRACARLRLVQSDPFATAPAPEYRAPKSMGVTDKARIGSSIDGDPLLVTLAGVMAAIVASSGGGKTGILQALGEVTTACRDAITVDLDPHGDGLEDLGPAARLQGRTHEQIEHALLFLLMLCKARARLRKQLGMGRKWITSPQHPALVVLFDEFPKASALAKKLAFELLLVGRKEGVWVVLASQGGTKTYLGESIAQMLAMQIMGPCKVGDTRAVMGEGSVAEGWLPHRLSPATDTDPRDAGHVYAKGVPGAQDTPVEYKIHEHPKGQLARLAEERRDAGLLDPDADSLQAMASVDLPDYVEAEYDVEGNLKKEAPVELLTWEQLLRLCEADPPAKAVTPDTPARAAVRDAAAAMDEQGVDRMRTERLVETLAARSPDVYRGLTVESLRGLLGEGGAGAPVTLGPLDGLSNPRGYKIGALRDAL